MGRATHARLGPVSVTSLSRCQSRPVKMKPTSKKSATGRHDDLKCFSLLAVRCRREIETILKTVGQDSNLQPRRREASANQKTIGRRWHAGDGKNLGKVMLASRAAASQIVRVCVFVSSGLELLLSRHAPCGTNMQSLGKTLTRQTNNPWQKSSENISARHQTHKHTHTAQKALGLKNKHALLFLLSVNRSGTSLLGLAYELTMFPEFHPPRGPF